MSKMYPRFLGQKMSKVKSDSDVKYHKVSSGVPELQCTLGCITTEIGKDPTIKISLLETALLGEFDTEEVLEMSPVEPFLV